MPIVLRDYQEKIIADLREAYRQGFRAPLVVSPTGSGKTRTFAFLSERLCFSRKRLVIMVHREELVAQISAALNDAGVPHGLILAGSLYDVRLPVHVASVQTLVNRLDRIAVPDYVIGDEGHHFLPKTMWGKCILHWQAENPALKINLWTATPERLGGEGLGEMCDTMILGPTTGELIERGFLSPYRLFAPRTQLDFSGVTSRGGDFAKNEISAAMDKPKITGDAVMHYRKLCDGAPSVAFCASVEHAHHTAEQFRAIGYTAAAVDGKMDKHERRRVMDDFSRGRLHVLTSADIVSEGVDVPGLVGAILLRPTQSVALYLQQVGRALRTAPGKECAYIIDHVSNSARHGLPDDPREWSLFGTAKGKKKSDAPGCRQCPKCYAISPLAAQKCRDCGAPFPVKERVIEQVDGELTEIEVARMKREAVETQAKAKSLDDLKALAKQLGRKEGWAVHVFEARQKKEQQRIAEIQARRAAREMQQ